MRLKCIHGFYMFFETRVGQIADYMGYSGFDLVPMRDFYTFDLLSRAPKHSLAGKDLLGINAVETFEGEPWEVFEANEFVFDIVSGELVPINSIFSIFKISESGNLYTSSGLLRAGSLNTRSERISGFDGWFSRDRMTWLYSEVTYV